jgi:hypothetical protein
LDNTRKGKLAMCGCEKYNLLCARLHFSLFRREESSSTKLFARLLVCTHFADKSEKEKGIIVSKT